MHRRTRRLWIVAPLVALLLAFSAAPGRGCPMCAENLPSGDEAASGESGLPDNPSGAQSPQLAEGFYYSILLMMGVPYLLLAGGGATVYMLVRNARKTISPGAPGGVA